MKEIYLDYSATTPTRKEALKEAIPYFTKKFGNASSFHYKGLEARNAVNHARNKIAKILNCENEEIIFTGSGTESINLALKGIAFREILAGKKGTIISQATEHHAIIETLKWLDKMGFRILMIKPEQNGIIKTENLRKTLLENKDTILVSIMYANNEIGVIQNIEELSKVCKEFNVPMHTDACQGAEYLELDVKKLGIQMMTLNGSKVYAFKGSGLLYKDKNLKIEPLIHGGAHEFGLRAGTENVAGIVAIAKALELAEKEKKKEGKRLTQLRDYMIKRIITEIPKSYLNGEAKQRLPNNINISFEGLEGESILLRLNEKKIFASTGSACASQSLDPSHVLLGIGRSHELAHGSIRFSLGKETTKKQIDYTIKELSKIIKELRQMSAAWRG
jgi:cysteine desulfurase